MPSGLYLLGSRSGARRNFMTLNWATQVAAEPKLLAVSVERDAVTADLVGASGVFSLSLLDRADRAVVRKFVKPATDDPTARTLNGVAYRDGPATGAPVLRDAVGSFECEVRTTLEFASHTLFVGEVVAVTLGDALSAGDAAEVLSMSDTRMNYGG